MVPPRTKAAIEGADELGPLDAPQRVLEPLEPLEDDPILEDIPPAPVAMSVLDRVRARRAEVMAERTIDLEVPGYDGDLVVRFRPLEGPVFARLAFALNPQAGERMEDRRHSAIYTEALIEGCVEVMVRPAPGAPPVPLTEDPPPVRFEQRLADLLGFEAKTARDVVRGVYGREAAMVQHVMALFGFSSDTSLEVDEAVAGE